MHPPAFSSFVGIGTAHFVIRADGAPARTVCFVGPDLVDEGKAYPTGSYFCCVRNEILPSDSVCL